MDREGIGDRLAGGYRIRRTCLRDGEIGRGQYNNCHDCRVAIGRIQVFTDLVFDGIGASGGQRRYRHFSCGGIQHHARI